ncbi:MAG: hypothetical protein IJT06_03420 [Selenomonadaceae bacterium]|nr:hypothetical protein [Selenomonadaceae bacterium]
MIKKVSLLVVALLMMSLSQAFAENESEIEYNFPPDYAIYGGSEKNFVAEFNKAAATAGIFQIKNAEPFADIDGDPVYELAFEGVSEKVGAALQQNCTIRELKIGGLSRISFTTFDQSVAEKIFKLMLPMLNLPDMPFEEIQNNIVQNPSGKDVSITVLSFEDKDNTSIYMIQFLCNN